MSQHHDTAASNDVDLAGHDELDGDDFDADARATRPRGRGNRKWWLIGVVGIMLMSIFAAWFGLSASRGVDAKQAGFKVISDSEVKVIWDVVTLEEKAPVTCTLITMNDKRDVLGTKVVQLPKSEYKSTRYTQVVKTTSRAVTGTVKECHYTEGGRAPRQ